MKSMQPILMSHAAGAILGVLMLVSSPTSGQQAAPNAANPPPQAGMTIEPEPGKQPPSTKFTNTTEREMAVIYGPERFSVKPGTSKSVPTPPAQAELKIAMVVGKEHRLWYENVTGPNVRKFFLPRNWEKLKGAR